MLPGQVPVSILVLMDIELKLIIVGKTEKRESQSFNPCFNGYRT